MVPLQALMALMLARQSGSSVNTEGARPGGFISGKALCGMLFISLLVSGTGVYCAFFGCFLLVLAGVYAVMQWGNWRNLGIACLLCAWTSVLTVAHLTPTLLYHRSHGFNEQAVRRIHFESEIYGLKPIQLVLPTTYHRIPFMARLKESYLSEGLLNNENDSAALGIIGSIGFAFLLLQFLRRSKKDCSERAETIQSLAVFNGGALLLGTIGGIGSLFSFVASPWIRGYCRISVYIGFFGIAAIFLVLDPLLARLCHGPKRAWLYAPLLLAALAFGILDQTSPQMHGNYTELKAAYARRKQFVQQLEGSLPRGAKIFQLPYTSYPEFSGYCWSDGSDALKPYLFSSSLHWSFGAVRGREDDSQNLMLATSSPPALLEKLALAGYDGLLIDRLAYADLARGLEKVFAGLIGLPPVCGDKNRWVFFYLDGYRQVARSTWTRKEWEQASEEFSRPVVPLFGKGLGSLEGTATDLTRFCLSRGELILSNPASCAREVEVEFEAERPYGPANLQVQCLDVHKAILLGEKAQTCRFRLTVPPGKTRMLFTCDGEDHVATYGDTRQFFHARRSYRLLNFQVTPVCWAQPHQLVSSYTQSKK
jgi:phosphoglycerol transferase